MLTQYQQNAIESIKILEVDDDLNFTISSRIEAVQIFGKFLNDSGFNIPGIIEVGSFEAHDFQLKVWVMSFDTYFFLILFPNHVINIKFYYNDNGPDFDMELGTLTELIIQPELLRVNILEFHARFELLLLVYKEKDN